MALEVGTKLGRYEIRSKLGEGGMGEVYLAEDTGLHRKVALKILSAAVASNQDRMRRFNQEATAAAALNHPNVAHIYEIGESEGTIFIAMEFIDGQTLREKIHRDKAPLQKLLKYLTQVAEGLTKAHGAGIVHRDLKPDNVMITRDGYAKILDFGLAKLVEPQRTFEPDDTGSSEIATAVMPQESIPGMVMGTLGYMSPEQATGRVKEIDHRSDIFSFGCILFEAATGQKAFAGKDALDSLHKIVHAPTPQIRDFNATTPDELQRIVRRCLAKEPDKRYQSIKEVAIELEELRQELKDATELEYSAQPTSSGAAASIGTAQPESSHPSASGTVPIGTARSTSSAEYLVSEIKRHKRGAILGLTALIVLVGMITFGLYKLLTQNRAKPTTSSEAMKFTRLTTSGKATSVAISPDGKYVVHVVADGGEQSLWLRQVATDSNVQILPPAAVSYNGLAFSPDGNFVYFLKREPGSRSALYRMPALGAAPTKVNPDAAAPIALSPDGRRLTFSRDERGSTECKLLASNVDGTAEEKLAAVNHPEHFLEAAWSPDGKVIAYAVASRTERRLDIASVRIEDRTVRAITSQEGGANTAGMAWLPDASGLVIVASNRDTGLFTQVWEVSYPEGETRRITNDQNSYSGLSLTADSNHLATIQEEQPADIWVVPDGDSSHARQATSGVGKNDGAQGITWVPDGRMVYTSLRGGIGQIWIAEPNGRNQKQLTADGRRNINPSVTPDGRYIVFTSIRPKRPEIWRIDLDGGNPRQLTSTGGDLPHCLPDGKWVVYELVSSSGSALMKVSIDGGESVKLNTLRGRSAWAVSPDGRLIARFVRRTEEDTGAKIELVPLEEGAPIKILELPPTIGTRRRIAWTPDGSSLAYIDALGGVSNIWIQSIEGGAAKQLTNFTSDQIYWFAWSSDGKQLALSRGKLISDVVLISDFR